MASPSSSMLNLLSSFLFGSEFTTEYIGTDLEETATTMTQPSDSYSEESIASVNPSEQVQDESNMADKMSRYISFKHNKRSDTLYVKQCILHDLGLYLKEKTSVCQE